MTSNVQFVSDVLTPAVLILFTAVLLGVGCSSKSSAQWGKVLKYDKGGSLFYTSNVTEEEARRLGDYLLKVGFFQDDEPRISQLLAFLERFCKWAG